MTNKWNQLSPDLVGAVSHYLDTVDELRSMSQTCQLWRSGQLPEPLARAKFLHHHKWPLSFADFRPRDQRWTSFIEHRKLVDTRRRTHRAAYMPFNVGDCHSVVSTPSFLWVCDPAQDKVISLNAKGIVRSRLETSTLSLNSTSSTSMELDIIGRTTIDCVYDVELGCAALRPLILPLDVKGDIVNVRLFSSSTGRCVAQTKLTNVAHTTLVAQYVDAASRTIGVLTRMSQIELNTQQEMDHYEMHFCSFSMRPSSDQDQDRQDQTDMVFSDWQSVTLDALAYPSQTQIGFWFNMQRRCVLLFARVADRHFLLVNGPLSKSRRFDDVELRQIVRFDLQTGDRGAISARAAKCAVLATQFDDHFDDACEMQVDWSDDLIVLRNDRTMRQLDLTTLLVRGQSYQDCECYNQDVAIAANAASALRLFKCRSMLEEENWHGWQFDTDHNKSYFVWSPQRQVVPTSDVCMNVQDAASSQDDQEIKKYVRLLEADVGGGGTCRSRNNNNQFI